MIGAGICFSGPGHGISARAAEVSNAIAAMAPASVRYDIAQSTRVCHPALALRAQADLVAIGSQGGAFSQSPAAALLSSTPSALGSTTTPYRSRAAATLT